MSSILFLCIAVFMQIGMAAKLPKCDSGGLKCGDGSCIAENLLCDGIKNCPRGEDERDCQNTNSTSKSLSRVLGLYGCTSSQYQCWNGYCIPGYWRCDGYRDCSYGEDEQGCNDYQTTEPWFTTPAQVGCSSSMFQCYNGTCISNASVCNGVYDCSFGEDEHYCSAYSTTTNPDPTPSCESSQFQCWNGGCIPIQWICDADLDCSHGEDEQNCNGTIDPSCSTSQFQCHDGRCIPESWVCDGLHDCSQNEDEMDCNNHSINTTSPPLVPLPNTTTVSPMVCANPYDLVGDRCVYLNPVTSATWNEARYMCERFGGDLVILDSLIFFSDIIHYMKKREMTLRDYWVGGSNSGTGGKWKWLNGADVTMGTPFWAFYGTSSSTYEQEPKKLETENHTSSYLISPLQPEDSCAYLDQSRFYYMANTDCGDQKAFICQVRSWETSEVRSLGVPDIKELNTERLKEMLEIIQAMAHHVT